MLKIFVSQPIDSLTVDQIKSNRSDSLLYLRSIIDDPFEVVSSIYEVDNDVAYTTLSTLSKSFLAIEKSNFVYFIKGWESSKNCMIEHQAAVEYGIKTIYE